MAGVVDRDRSIDARRLQQQWKTKPRSSPRSLRRRSPATVSDRHLHAVGGATPKSVDMVVSPPILGDVIGGVGYRVGLVVVLVDGGLMTVRSATVDRR